MSYAGEASTPNTIKGSETYKNARKNQKNCWFNPTVFLIAFYNIHSLLILQIRYF